MTPDLTFVGAPKPKASTATAIDAKVKQGVWSISTDTDSFRQVIVTLNIPKDMETFDLQFQVTGQNLSASVYNVHFIIMR